MTEKYERIENYPGLNTNPTVDRPYKEIAYNAGNGLVARVRFEARSEKPSIQSDVELELVSSDPIVFVSGSLVDEEGQVLRINGKGFVREQQSHRALAGNAEVVIDEWFDWIAKENIIDDLVNAWVTMNAFEAMFPMADEPMAGEAVI